jgi:hypothetical protein
MRNHTTHTRDAALLRLSRINRWLVAGSIVLTGVLADVAANAFPGKTKRSSASSSARRSETHKSSPTGVLASPEQAPEASTGSQSSSSGEASSSESSGSGSSSGEASSSESSGSEPSTSSGSSSESSASSGASEESSASSGASEESSGPVVSGGS